MSSQKRKSESKGYGNTPIAPKRTTTTTTNQKLVFECFKLASQKKIDEMLELLADDVIIYEPFSKKENGLRGKLAVRSFLDMITLASDDSLHYDISVEEDRNDKIVTLVVFEKGDKITSKFTFEMTPSKAKDKKKIRVVRVEFLDDHQD
jgi:ribosomal protein L44E